MSRELNHVRKQARLQAHAHRMRFAPSEPERVLRLPAALVICELPAALLLVVRELAR